jgi:hypothetical protein
LARGGLAEVSAFDRLLEELLRRGVRFVVIGVWGANYWARSAGTTFATQDRDLFLPLEPANLLAAWEAARATGYELWSGAEPLGEPLDLWLAERVVERQAGVKALRRDGRFHAGDGRVRLRTGLGRAPPLLGRGERDPSGAIGAHCSFEDPL